MDESSLSLLRGRALSVFLAELSLLFFGTFVLHGLMEGISWSLFIETSLCPSFIRILLQFIALHSHHHPVAPDTRVVELHYC
jgi:hypothetical protein